MEMSKWVLRFERLLPDYYAVYKVREDPMKIFHVGSYVREEGEWVFYFSSHTHTNAGLTRGEMEKMVSAFDRIARSDEIVADAGITAHHCASLGCDRAGFVKSEQRGAYLCPTHALTGPITSTETAEGSSDEKDARAEVIRYVRRLIDYGKGYGDAEFDDLSLGGIADRIIRVIASAETAEGSSDGG